MPGGRGHVERESREVQVVLTKEDGRDVGGHMDEFC